MVIYIYVPSLLSCTLWRKEHLSKLMVDLVTIYSQNTRGLNCSQKHRDVFQYFRKKKYNIICLQDVHLENKMEDFTKKMNGVFRGI